MKNNLQHNLKAGFTIVEIVVVLFIFTVISRVILFHYKDFDQRVVLDTTAQDIGLLVRKAQSESVNGRYPILEANQFHPSSDWKPSYGLFVDPQAQQFFFFYDGDNDTIPFNMDASVCENPNIPTECLDFYEIVGTNQIGEVCFEAIDGSCAQTVNNFAVIFQRPFPDANIFYNYTLPFGLGTPGTSTIKLEIKGPNGSRYIRISPLGQISVLGA